jgi:hypothetical protein
MKKLKTTKERDYEEKYDRIKDERTAIVITMMVVATILYLIGTYIDVFNDLFTK